MELATRDTKRGGGSSLEPVPRRRQALAGGSMREPRACQTSRTKHRFKDKITKNFKMVTTEHRAPSSRWGPRDCRSPHP